MLPIVPCLNPRNGRYLRDSGVGGRLKVLRADATRMCLLYLAVQFLLGKSPNLDQLQESIKGDLTVVVVSPGISLSQAWTTSSDGQVPYMGWNSKCCVVEPKHAVKSAWQ